MRHTKDNHNTDNQDSKQSSLGRPLAALLIAVALVAALSFVPWGKITGNYLKDYNLLGDLWPADSAMIAEGMAANEVIDPELVAEMMRVDSLKQDFKSTNSVDSVEAIAEVRIIDSQVPRINGEMIIEDYTPDQRGLARLKNSLADKNRLARIAVMGDSYIEGDIFTQDIRQYLQNMYGGHGVGYLPAHSQVAGFRRTVGHSDQGWNHYDVQKASRSKYFNIAGEYYTGDNGATVTYKGTKSPRLDSWDVSRLMFVAPNSGKIILTTDNDTVTYQITGSPDVQLISLESPTKKLNIRSYVNGLVYLGAWLESETGVSVDCMSIRGDSGIGHRKLNVELAEQMRQFVDYDLIIMEYGINALSAQQSNYDHYGSILAEVAQKLKECYPNADILMLGVGDRGQKSNGEVHSIPTINNMVAAQRKAAQQAGVLFWDMREAMGGEDAIVQWREEKLVNADYIHLNSKGGKAMADLLIESLTKALNE